MVKTMHGAPRYAGIAGNPVAHSLSPLLHQHWIRKLGLNARYEAWKVNEKDFAAHVRERFEDENFTGMNVTLPHKGAALALAQSASLAARHAGAANLLVRKNGALHADNTDMEGFCAPLRQKRPDTDWKTQKAVIVGAGGAARAVLVALMVLHTGRLVLLNRTDSRARALAGQYGGKITCCPWEDRHEALQGAALLVNASAAGMHGMPPLDLSPQGLPKGALVYDLVYTPAQTPLLAAAEAAGIETLSGLEMLIAQARPSFAAFFGLEPPERSGARALLASELEKRP